MSNSSAVIPERPTVLRDRPTWVSYAQITAWGWFVYSFAPAVALLRNELELSRTLEGLYSTALALGGILAGVAAARVVALIGRGPVMRLGSVAAVVGLTLFVVTTSFASTLLGVVLVGGGATLAMIGVNAFLTEHQGPAAPRTMSEGNGIATAVGLLGPRAVGTGVAIGWGWRPAFVAVLIAYVVIELARGRALHLYDGTHGHRSAEPGHAPTGPLPRLYWYTWVVVIMCIGTEFCMTLWGSDLLRDRAGLGQAAAAASIATIVGGMAVGRLVGAPLLSTRDPETVMIGALVIAGVGFSLAWVATSAALILIGFAVAGLGIGLLWPLGISRAIRASAGRNDRASALASVAAALASGIAPFALGALADRVGVHTAFLIVPTLIIAAIVLIHFARVPLDLAEDPEA